MLGCSMLLVLMLVIPFSNLEERAFIEDSVRHLAISDVF